MSSMFFNDVEAAKIAVNMERSGLRFYTAMAARTKDANVKRVFEQLAADEKEHMAIFQELHQKLLDEPRRQSYLDADELDGYMQRLVETHVFPDEAAVDAAAGQVESDIMALGIAMRTERDAILFYQEMLDFTDSKAAREAIARILDEERRHLVILAERSEECEKLVG